LTGNPNSALAKIDDTSSSLQIALGPHHQPT